MSAKDRRCKVSDSRRAPFRVYNTAMHRGIPLGFGGFTFNRPACLLCRCFDGQECRYKYCKHCFVHLLGISGMYGSRRRRAVGAIIRRSRKLYLKMSKEAHNAE